MTITACYLLTTLTPSVHLAGFLVHLVLTFPGSISSWNKGNWTGASEDKIGLYNTKLLLLNSPLRTLHSSHPVLFPLKKARMQQNTWTFSCNVMIKLSLTMHWEFFFPVVFARVVLRLGLWNRKECLLEVYAAEQKSGLLGSISNSATESWNGPWPRHLNWGMEGFIDL